MCAKRYGSDRIKLVLQDVDPEGRRLPSVKSASWWDGRSCPLALRRGACSRFQRNRIEGIQYEYQRGRKHCYLLGTTSLIFKDEVVGPAHIVAIGLLAILALGCNLAEVQLRRLLPLAARDVAPLRPRHGVGQQGFDVARSER